MTCGFEFRVSSPAITSPEIYDDFDRYIGCSTRLSSSNDVSLFTLALPPPKTREDETKGTSERRARCCQRLDKRMREKS
jgi:hypothetical protein